MLRRPRKREGVRGLLRSQPGGGEARAGGSLGWISDSNAEMRLQDGLPGRWLLAPQEEAGAGGGRSQHRPGGLRETVARPQGYATPTPEEGTLALHLHLHGPALRSHVPPGTSSPSGRREASAGPGLPYQPAAWTAPWVPGTRFRFCPRPEGEEEEGPAAPATERQQGLAMREEGFPLFSLPPPPAPSRATLAKHGT